jgi:hypothetical protein
MDLQAVALAAVEQAAAQAFDLINSPDWEDLGENDDVFASRRQTDAGIYMTKSVGVIRKSAEAVRSLLWTYSRKKEWDENLEEIQVVQQFSDNFRIMYQRFNAPWPVSSRDFVLATRYQDVEGGILLVGRSVDAGVPERDGIVRGEVLASAYYLKRLNENNTEVTYMAGVDPKGSIPTMVVNAVGKKQALLVGKIRAVAERE